MHRLAWRLLRRFRSTVPGVVRISDTRSVARETGGPAGRDIRVRTRRTSKFFHRRVRTVVRQRFDNRKARPAIRAVRERITKPPIGWIENFAQAIDASRDIGENERCFVAALFAFADFKSVVADCIEERRRRCSAQSRGEASPFESAAEIAPENCDGLRLQ